MADEANQVDNVKRKGEELQKMQEESTSEEKAKKSEDNMEKAKEKAEGEHMEEVRKTPKIQVAGDVVEEEGQQAKKVAVDCATTYSTTIPFFYRAHDPYPHQLIMF